MKPGEVKVNDVVKTTYKGITKCHTVKEVDYKNSPGERLLLQERKSGIKTMSYVAPSEIAWVVKTI
jgi:hypothetical protein